MQCAPTGSSQAWRPCSGSAHRQKPVEGGISVSLLTPLPPRPAYRAPRPAPTPCPPPNPPPQPTPHLLTSTRPSTWRCRVAACSSSRRRCSCRDATWRSAPDSAATAWRLNCGGGRQGGWTRASDSHVQTLHAAACCLLEEHAGRQAFGAYPSQSGSWLSSVPRYQQACHSRPDLVGAGNSQQALQLPHPRLLQGDALLERIGLCSQGCRAMRADKRWGRQHVPSQQSCVAADLSNSARAGCSTPSPACEHAASVCAADLTARLPGEPPARHSRPARAAAGAAAPPGLAPAGNGPAAAVREQCKGETINPGSRSHRSAWQARRQV